MTKDEALKLALEALHGFIPYLPLNDEAQCGRYDKAITAIKAVLAQPEQEQLMSDQINYGMSVTQGGKRIDPMSIYKEPEQEPVAHSVVAGALFDFMGWLTSRNKRLTLSGADEASPAVEAIQEFSEKRGLSLKDAEVGFWTEFLFTPPQRKPLTDDEIDKIWVTHTFIQATDRRQQAFARAIEAAHGIKGEA